MGSQTTLYPTSQVDGTGRSSCHPYHSFTFNDLRHRLPPAISTNPCLQDTYVQVENTWVPIQPASYPGAPMPPLTHDYLFNHGQDATFQFPHGVFPYPAYHDADPAFNGEDLDMSGDDDIEGLDSNAQLRSQQLNSDGTPRRPMNAFMIFARKRRPMVSSEQPTMRTGEISKILSKEWSEMPKEDKQFYLDQAKKLKDTFNMRWPDYVYRRRPNNSRKRRKHGGTSGVGPVRNNDASSDGRMGTPAESTGGTHSGDESQSQSADSVSSPLSTQSKLLYPPADNYGRRSPGQISDRSQTPSVASVGYGVGSAYIPAANSKILGEETSLGLAEAQRDFYGSAQGAYYADLNHGAPFGHNHPAEPNSQMQGWHSFDENVPSGVVVALTPSPPPIAASPSHLAQPALNPDISNHVYAPSAWTKVSSGPDPHLFEESSKLWGVSSSLGDHQGVDGQGMHTLLAGEDSTLGVSLLGFRSEGPSNSTIPATLPYGNSNEASLIEGGHYHSAYIDAGGLAQPSHGPRSTPSASPYQRSLPTLHESSSSPYINANRWAPGTHPN
ncbi:hypothetical protein FRC08_002152 [Ceratobasidium sp. 394]|nr:hypothetical protein FRC08_002152 [Ceratobasidium sp. 394]